MGQASVSITTSSSSFSSSSLLVFFPASIGCGSSGPLAFACDSDGPAGHSGKVSDVGEAGEAGETGDGGDVGEVGDGGERGGDGKGRSTRPSLSRLCLASESAGATRGSELFSSVVLGFFRGCT